MSGDTVTAHRPSFGHCETFLVASFGSPKKCPIARLIIFECPDDGGRGGGKHMSKLGGNRGADYSVACNRHGCILHVCSPWRRTVEWVHS